MFANGLRYNAPSLDWRRGAMLHSCHGVAEAVWESLEINDCRPMPMKQGRREPR
jgi:hypothetical protein